MVDLGTACFGAVPLDCPVCGRGLNVPVYAAGGYGAVTLNVDVDYLRAHFLTHSQHDGEPLPAAA